MKDRPPIRHLLFTVALVLVLAAASCSPNPRGQETGETAQQVRSLLSVGAAHAGIGEWAEAIEAYSQAEKLAPGEPVIHFNTALAYFLSGDLENAEGSLGSSGPNSPHPLRAKSSFLRSKIALERGDSALQIDLLREAMELDPEDAVYPYALSRLLARDGDEVGELLTLALDLWPANQRLGAELAQWLLQRPTPEARLDAVALLEHLSQGNELAQPSALVERGRRELEADPGASQVPVALRQAINLLRPGKRFQEDSAQLEQRLALSAVLDPTGWDLRQRRALTSPALSFEAADLLPSVITADASPVLDVILANDLTGPAQEAQREADLAILSAKDLRVLSAHDDAPVIVAEHEGGLHRLLAGELDGDGLMELVALGSSGVHLWSRDASGSWAEIQGSTGLLEISLSDGVLIDFEHDGDLDLLAFDSEGDLLLVVHRGESGWGEPEPAPLPETNPVRAIHTSDLDGDADQDLLLAGDAEIVLLRNWRQGQFEVWQRLPVPGAVDDLLTLDYDGDGDFDLVATATGNLLFWKNEGNFGFKHDPVAAAGAAELGLAAHRLTPADLDLDGDLDLLVSISDPSGASTLAALENAGWGRWFAELSLLPARPNPISGVLPIDLDGDRDFDLVSWGEGGLETFRSHGAEEQGSIQLFLRGLPGKVPLDGRGASVQIVAGPASQWLELERPQVTIGLGSSSPTLIRVTWPNGISEYVFRPEVGDEVVVEQVLRIEGSCPFLYASDGETLAFVTDILGLSPLGMLASLGSHSLGSYSVGHYVQPDPEEYLRLPDWVSEIDGGIELAVTEELREVAYLDQFELVVIDTPPGVEAYNGERWIEPPVAGLDLHLLGPLEQAISVLDDEGREVLDLVANLDSVFASPALDTRLYQGAVEPHSLTIELPRTVAQSPRPTLVMNGWLHWANTSTNVARAQDPEGAPMFPRLEVPDGNGGWRTTDISVGLPAGKSKPVVVDLGSALDPEDPRVRITTDFEVHWDHIAVAERLASEDTEHREYRLAPASASLAFGGFSRWVRPAVNGPYLFDWQERRPYPWRESAEKGPVRLSWQEHEGLYTAFGPVQDLLLAADDRLVVIGSGDQIRMRFETASLPTPPAGWQRTYFLHSEGWEKDGDPNVACSQTVLPLPSRAMTSYPCNNQETRLETGLRFASDPRLSRLTRWVSRTRLELRAAHQIKNRP